MPWQLKKEDKFSLYRPLFSTVLELDNALSNISIDENKVVDCTNLTLIGSTITMLTKAYQQHQEMNYSFIVVISAKEDIDALEEYFIAVPTVSEAIDYIYMDELERNI
jgi:uracil phosphoribosyltransferase